MPGEIHVVAIWERGRHAEDRILGDIAERFRVLDVVDVTWSPAVFTTNLVRFYGTALPPGSDKEQQCGTGEFVVVVVEDRQPRHRVRRAGRRISRVNGALVDAKARYRGWAGGDYRVHASDDAREAERDLVLLFGRRSRSFDSTSAPSRHEHHADLVGTHGWRDLDELLLALEVTAGCRAPVTTPDDDLRIEVGDLWWAERIAGGVELGDGRRRLSVGGEELCVHLAPRGRWHLAGR